jgi:hypothetical protein
MEEKKTTISKCASRTIRRSIKERAFEFCLQHQVQAKFHEPVPIAYN